jgi:hypothetical protein
MNLSSFGADGHEQYYAESQAKYGQSGVWSHINKGLTLAERLLGLAGPKPKEVQIQQPSSTNWVVPAVAVAGVSLVAIALISKAGKRRRK